MFVACPSLKQEASTRVHTSESLVWRFLELLIVMAAETPRRRPSHSRRIPVQKTLFGAPVTGQSFCGEAWSKRETQALVDHVMLMGDAHVWPAFPRNSKFWMDAADFVFEQSQSSTKRTGNYAF